MVLGGQVYPPVFFIGRWRLAGTAIKAGKGAKQVNKKRGKAAKAKPGITNPGWRQAEKLLPGVRLAAVATNEPAEGGRVERRRQSIWLSSLFRTFFIKGSNPISPR
jgi:hypothetical protein